MTNNKVIIDGVDVSKCEYYMGGTYGYCNACKDDIDGASETPCKDYDCCYYKQLQRKTQECEKLKKELMSSEKWRISAENALEKLDLKIGKLKSALEEIEGLAKSINDEFENDDIEQQLHYAQDISKQIQEIINKAKEQE